MDDDALRSWVALEGNFGLSNPAIAIDARGLRLRHADHAAVLGLPENLTAVLRKERDPPRT